MQTADVKSVGIGAGQIGRAMAQAALRAGRQVAIASSRGPESLTSAVEALGDGVSAGTVKDAAAADIVVLAVMWPQVPQAVEGLDWKRRIVIDPTNDFDPSDLDGRTSSEVVADLVAPARVVKAANTLAAAVLGSDPHQAGGQMQQVRAPLAGHNLIRLPCARRAPAAGVSVGPLRAGPLGCRKEHHD